MILLKVPRRNSTYGNPSRLGDIGKDITGRSNIPPHLEWFAILESTWTANYPWNIISAPSSVPVSSIFAALNPSVESFRPNRRQKTNSRQALLNLIIMYQSHACSSGPDDSFRPRRIGAHDFALANFWKARYKFMCLLTDFRSPNWADTGSKRYKNVGVIIEKYTTRASTKEGWKQLLPSWIRGDTPPPPASWINPGLNIMGKEIISKYEKWGKL